ncbi:uncharacterized protein LOC133392912 [Anopheles gambiae]|uniref:uncharacterized protein LOC133392912 n=1 Tax=Anopheles gambiae TaxID=7165 RepID=UPI002AC97482|nr:uncharacterized protein LOC133392912 [Anopheles gambiae]
MYFLAFSQRDLTFPRFPLQGYWLNIVIFAQMETSHHKGSLAAMREAKAEEQTNLPTPGMVCFLPDADNQHANSADKIQQEKIALAAVTVSAETSSYSSASDRSSTSNGETGDSDITLNDIESYTRFENDLISISSDMAESSQPLRKRLPPAKKRKYDYVESKVKQYFKPPTKCRSKQAQSQ